MSSLSKISLSDFIPVAVLSFAVLCFTGCGKNVSYEIARDGESQYAIVLSGRASPSEKHAADEFQYFVKEATGAEIPIVGEEDLRALEPPRIFIGSGKLADVIIAEGKQVDWKALGDEGFIIRTVPDAYYLPDIIIAGGRLRGTMYGVYTFLNHLGFRWYTRDVIRYPEGRKLVISHLDEKVIPPFMYRVPYIKEAFDPDWAARNRVHSGGDPEDLARGGKMGILGAEKY